ncbi:MAG: hypothetical protein ACOY3E_01340 [Pseudomonadota bacterium]
MKRLWLALLLVFSLLLVADGLFSAAAWWTERGCAKRQQAFDVSRQACADEPASPMLQTWQQQVVAVRSARAFAFAGFFTLSVVLIRRNRVVT